MFLRYKAPQQGLRRTSKVQVEVQDLTLRYVVLKVTDFAPRCQVS